MKVNFYDDPEKMRDFVVLTKDQFLCSYSYLTEEEYDNTKAIYLKQHIDHKVKKIIDEFNLPANYIQVSIDDDDMYSIIIDNGIWLSCASGIEVYDELITLERGIAIGRDTIWKQLCDYIHLTKKQF